MIHFNALMNVVNTNMDDTKMHLGYDYKFTADKLIVTFHKPGDETAVIKQLVWENASDRLAEIVEDVREFLANQCNAVAENGIRCTLDHGHDGEHHGYYAAAVCRWGGEPSPAATIAQIEARGNVRKVEIFVNGNGRDEMRFTSNVSPDNTMELFRTENGAPAMIEWDMASLEETEHIGLEMDGLTVTGYDGVFEVGEEVWDWLEYLGFHCDMVRDTWVQPI